MIENPLRRISAILAIVMSVGCSSFGQPRSGVAPEAVGMRTFNTSATNSKAQASRPYVVMISIDGYRHDYNRLFKPPNLNQIASEGVAAESLRPIYPTKTFPNHYSIATGLYADKHELISNEFYDPRRGLSYAIRDRKAVEDGSWYAGDPLWNSVQKQGLLTATYFWVGSEAAVQGMRPNYYFRYDTATPIERQVDQTLEWLKLPEERRPHLIMLYFDEVDAAAHRNGAESVQARDAVLTIDAAIGRLRQNLADLDLPVNLIVVSDHGMEDLETKKMLVIDESEEVSALLPKFKAVGVGPQILLYLNPGESPSVIPQMQKALKRNVQNVRVLRREEMRPLNLSASYKAGDLVIEADQPWSIGTKAQPPIVSKANHGWDPTRSKSMHGIFYATGPSFKTRTKLPTFEVIHVYPLVLATLGLKPLAPVDGRLEVARSSLRRDTNK